MSAGGVFLTSAAAEAAADATESLDAERDPYSDVNDESSAAAPRTPSRRASPLHAEDGPRQPQQQQRRSRDSVHAVATVSPAAAAMLQPHAPSVPAGAPTASPSPPRARRRTVVQQQQRAGTRATRTAAAVAAAHSAAAAASSSSPGAQPPRGTPVSRASGGAALLHTSVDLLSDREDDADDSVELFRVIEEEKRQRQQLLEEQQQIAARIAYLEQKAHRQALSERQQDELVRKQAEAVGMRERLLRNEHRRRELEEQRRAERFEMAQRVRMQQEAVVQAKLQQTVEQRRAAGASLRQQRQEWARVRMAAQQVDYERALTHRKEVLGIHSAKDAAVTATWRERAREARQLKQRVQDEEHELHAMQRARVSNLQGRVETVRQSTEHVREAREEVVARHARVRDRTVEEQQQMLMMKAQAEEVEREERRAQAQMLRQQMYEQLLTNRQFYDTVRVEAAESELQEARTRAREADYVRRQELHDRILIENHEREERLRRLQLGKQAKARENTLSELERQRALTSSGAVQVQRLREREQELLQRLGTLALPAGGTGAPSSSGVSPLASARMGRGAA